MGGSQVNKDIPEELIEAQQILQRRNIDINIQLLSYLGRDKRLRELLEQKYQNEATEERIMIAHGTTLGNGNEECEQLALSLKAKLAYWSISPFFTEILANLANFSKSIAILPYFLLTGKIFEAITERIRKLQLQYPETKFILIEPLGATVELASIITESLINL